MLGPTVPAAPLVIPTRRNPQPSTTKPLPVLGLYSPAPQSRQAACSVSALYLPSPHCRHAVCAVAALKVPAAQTLQTLAALLSWYQPSGQAWQCSLGWRSLSMW